MNTELKWNTPDTYKRTPFFIVTAAIIILVSCVLYCIPPIEIKWLALMLIPLMIIAIVLLPVSLKVMKLTSWVHLLGLIIVFVFIILLMNFFHYFLFFIVIIGIFCYQMINSILHFSQEKRRRQLVFHYIGTKGDVLPSHLSGSIAQWLKTQNIQYSYHRKQFLTIMEKGTIIKIILDKKAIKNADIYTIDIIPPVLSKTPVPEQYENEISNIVRTSIQHLS